MNSWKGFDRNTGGRRLHLEGYMHFSVPSHEPIKQNLECITTWAIPLREPAYHPPISKTWNSHWRSEIMQGSAAPITGEDSTRRCNTSRGTIANRTKPGFEEQRASPINLKTDRRTTQWRQHEELGFGLSLHAHS